MYRTGHLCCVPFFEEWLVKGRKKLEQRGVGRREMLGTEFRTVCDRGLHICRFNMRISFKIVFPFPQIANPQIPQTYMVRKSQIRILQYLQKVRKSKKKFQSANLRICDLRNLLADRPPLTVNIIKQPVHRRPTLDTL